MKPNRLFLIAGIACGALLTLAPFVGVFDTVFDLVREFEALDHSGIGDPSTVSAPVGQTLIPIVAGILLCPIGIALLLTSLKSLRRLPPDTSSPLHAS